MYKETLIGFVIQKLYNFCQRPHQDSIIQNLALRMLKISKFFGCKHKIHSFFFEFLMKTPILTAFLDILITYLFQGVYIQKTTTFKCI